MSYVTELLSNNEKIKIATREHIFGLLSKVWVAILLIVIILAAWIAGPIVRPVPAGETNFWNWLLLGLIPAAVVIIMEYLSWANRMYIVTNYRVIAVRGVINKSSFDTSIEKVNDISTQQSFWGRVFNYGTVELLSGSDAGDNKMNDIGNPLEFKRQLLEAKALANDIDDNQQGYTPQPLPPQPMPQPLPPPPAPTPSSSGTDLAARLRQLEEALRAGTITQEEYNTLRSRLLNQFSETR